MLGIISVPGTPLRFTPLDDGSAFAGIEGEEEGAGGAAGPDATGIELDPGPRGRTDGGCAAAPAIASMNAPRRESTLLTASGETWGAALGSPMPAAVVASSPGTDAGAAGGGP